jgi:hypothetical protein
MTPIAAVALVLAFVGFHQVTAAPSICRLDDVKVKTWDGSSTLMCDPSICDATLRTNIAQTAQLPMVDADTYKHIVHSLTNGSVKHAFNQAHISYVLALSKKQQELGVHGSVGEIGVYLGGFLLNLVAASLKDEPFVAIDIFSKDDVDGSGRIGPDGRLGIVTRHITDHGIPFDKDANVIIGDSTLLTAASLANKGFPAFRMFSVDGGHTLDQVRLGGVLGPWRCALCSMRVVCARMCSASKHSRTLLFVRACAVCTKHCVQQYRQAHQARCACVRSRGV